MNDEQYIAMPVTGLQTMLRTIAQVDEAQPTVVPDGVYGEQTVRAVTEFQRQHGLETTGVTNYETWQAICEAYSEAKIEVQPACPLEIEMSCRQVFLPGCRNKHILLVQSMLSALSDDYRELRDVRITGLYDDATQKAVRWLQQECGMTCSGIFTKACWRMLTGLYTMKIGTGEGENNLQPQ